MESGTPGSLAVVPFGPQLQSGRRLTLTESEVTASSTNSPVPYDCLLKSAPGAKPAGQINAICGSARFGTIWLFGPEVIVTVLAAWSAVTEYGPPSSVTADQ